MGYDPVARQDAENAALVANQALAIVQAISSGRAAGPWTLVEESTAVTDGQNLSVDTSSGPVTILLPIASVYGVSLRDNAGTWNTHPVTVEAPSGFLVDGSPTLIVDLPGYDVNFQLVDGAWRFTLQFLYGAV